MPDRVKEKLVELLSYFADGYVVENRHIGDGTKVCEIADHLIANGVTVQEWIPVAERLPEDDLPKDTKRLMIRCIVYTDKKTIKPCVRQRYKKKIGGQWALCPWEWNKDVFAKPTHWMPLPQPPK